MLLMDGRSCDDIDECKENPRICNGGKCTNTPGSFTCSCSGGLTTSPDGNTCEGTKLHPLFQPQFNLQSDALSEHWNLKMKH